MRVRYAEGLAPLLGIALVALTGSARAQTSGAPVAGFGAYHTLVIGNQQYRHLSSPKTPVADATAVTDMLRKDYGFTVRLLANATRTQIVDALAELRGKLRESDNLLIYYAGHGYLDREADRGYWLAVDADPRSPANWVSNADITDALRAFEISTRAFRLAERAMAPRHSRSRATRSPSSTRASTSAERNPIRPVSFIRSSVVTW